MLISCDGLKLRKFRRNLGNFSEKMSLGRFRVASDKKVKITIHNPVAFI